MLLNHRYYLFLLYSQYITQISKISDSIVNEIQKIGNEIKKKKFIKGRNQ